MSPVSSRALGTTQPLTKAFNSQLINKKMSTQSIVMHNSPPRPEAKTFSTRADSTQLGSHHISKQMLTLLRPEVVGYASPN